MPDGEVFTSPVDDSADGQKYFVFPGIYAGQRVQGLNLEFKSGRLLRATSESNQDLLDQILQIDDGANRIGEFGVGSNFGINRFCSDILYAERIGGTIHIAMGRAFAESGGINQSALHWDLIKDLRRESKILPDGVVVFNNEKFLF